jgi:hypothetical protein
MSLVDRWLSQVSQVSQSGVREVAEGVNRAEGQKETVAQSLAANCESKGGGGEFQIVRERAAARSSAYAAAKPAKAAKVVTRLDVYKSKRAAMWRDLTIVGQDLLAEGRKPGEIRRMFGLTWGEIERIRQAPR